MLPGPWKVMRGAGEGRGQATGARGTGTGALRGAVRAGINMSNVSPTPHPPSPPPARLITKESGTKGVGRIPSLTSRDSPGPATPSRANFADSSPGRWQGMVASRAAAITTTLRYDEPRRHNVTTSGMSLDGW